MQSALAKSLIFHTVLLVIIILSSFSFFGRKEVEPAITAITVDLKIAEKTNIPRAPTNKIVKPKPVNKPKPKPVVKPKPPEKKPEPKPKVEVKEKPKEKPKKPEKKPEPKKEVADDELTSLLKSLDDPEPEAQEITQNTESYNPAQEMTRSEISALIGKITKQIQACWNVPAGARNAADLVVLVDVDIAKDGRIKFVGFTEEGKYYSDSFYNVAADSARRAVLDPRCNPLKEIPPLDKYEIWSELTLEFDPKQQIY